MHILFGLTFLTVALCLGARKDRLIKKKEWN